MTPDAATIRRLLQACDFAGLFNELGWDRYSARVDVQLDKDQYAFIGVAEKRGVQVFACDGIPEAAVRQKLDRRLTRSAREHLVVYGSAGHDEQLWEWVRREPGKPAASRNLRVRASDPGDLIIQKLRTLTFELNEEQRLTTPDVAGRVKSAFDVDRVTKKFYDRFKSEHAAFMRFVGGIQHEPDLQWYTSLMLNRLMFVYFIQKKGFLDGDRDYLRTRLRRMREQHGHNRFYSFYRFFLLRLFHEGLGQAKSAREKELETLLGDVPFLNGGFFEVHDLEEKYPKIDIPDDAFEKLFAFFEEYDWHLDERPLRSGREINPDVVGYIFEKYINQKQMGAYYTKEDITEYISKNTIIPFLFDAAEKKCAIAFKPDAALWRLLRDDPDRYIYAAVRHGVIDSEGEVIQLPDEIAVGLDDVARRGGWNKRADDRYGLPTETWREHVARRRRCLDIREKLLGGDVHQINDLITLNLDIWQFARDAIVTAEGPELLRAFYYTLAGRVPREGTNEKFARGLSVLDPTCGSGAFLFAALRILETLYADCLERMRRFVDQLEHETPAPKGPAARRFLDFRAILGELDPARHPNERYFVLKTIIINNLFGVDIMAEAVEICKLRLFLKLVAQVERVDQIEPLPDIDFNIRAGNTLVGYISLDEIKSSVADRLPEWVDADLRRIREQMEDADTAYRLFRKQQMDAGGFVSVQDKARLRSRLHKLADELDDYLAREDPARDLEEWRKHRQPHHWLVEFYGLMKNGGFDVIIGNPPYVRTASVDYLDQRRMAMKIPDLYGHVLLRTLDLASPVARCGMIVPLSLSFGSDFADVRRQITAATYAWYSSFDNIPAALFSGVSQRCTIWIGAVASVTNGWETTRLNRWRSASRDVLFDGLSYTASYGWDEGDNGLLRVGSTSQLTVAHAIHRCFRRMAPLASGPRDSKYTLRIAPAARNFVSVSIACPPIIDASTHTLTPHEEQATLRFSDRQTQTASLALAIGELYFWHWLVHGDGFHVTNGLSVAAVDSLRSLDPSLLSRVAMLGECAELRRNEALVFKKNAGKYVGNYNYRGHAWLTRRSDLLIMAGLGCDRELSLHIFDHVQRTLVINESAGEKSIPTAIKAMFPPIEIDSDAESDLLREVDQVLMGRFGFSRDELDFLFERDPVFGTALSGEHESDE